MDANGQQFWMISEEDQLTGLQSMQWDKKTRVLKLLSERSDATYPTDRVLAQTFLDAPAAAVDAIGTWAYVNNDRNAINVSGAFDEPYELYSNSNVVIYDIAMNDDGFLYTIMQETGQDREVRLINPHNVDETIVLSLEEATTIDCIVTLPGGDDKNNAWVLDRKAGQLYKINGKPMPDRPVTLYDAGVERPCKEFPDQLEIIKDESRLIPESYTAVSIAANEKQQVAILLWPDETTQNAQVVFINTTGVSYPLELLGAIAPFSIGHVKSDLWAVKFAGFNEVITYTLTSKPDHPGESVVANGNRYPINAGTSSSIQNRPFCNGLVTPVHYQAQLKDQQFKPRPVYSLSKPSVAKLGIGYLQTAFDSLQAGTVWHRIYLEANIPQGTGIRVWLNAMEEKGDFVDKSAYPHDFGYVPNEYSSIYDNVPKGSYCYESSELPHNKSLLYCQSKSDESGLFTVLAQRTGIVVRNIKGRYLQIKIELFGNGQTTPEIAAIRFYSPRFSYLDKYLPELYRENIFGANADETGDASPSDFLQRYLCLFEGVLTPLEDKIANAHLVTNPTTAPAEVLDWLGLWIGLSLEAGMPEKQRRDMLSHAMTLYRYRGTYKGLSLALDLATDYMVKKGQLVILEDFRLRRTFATIIGTDFSVEDDPLLMDDIPSANSYIGDTFFLGDNTREGEKVQRELLAVFNADVFKTRHEKKTVDQFFSELSNRITVLVHREQPESIFKLIRKIVSLEAPAHIETRVLGASQPLITGLYSLIGIDTYLRSKPQLRPAKLDQFYFGREGQIIHRPSLDNRLD